MTRIYQTDYREIKKIMAEKDIRTVSELANTANINRVTLGKVLCGKAQPSSDVMEKLVFFLEISPYKAGEIFFSYTLRNA